MLLYPNCKINLGLTIVNKREDNYHNLETVFLPVHGLHDELDITPSDEGFFFEQQGLVVDCPPEKNLIVRTYLRMREMFPGKIGDVHIRFVKHIPFGAGLGGGSSDAAFTAKALNELFALWLTAEELRDVVRPLGADCAFFIDNRACFATGIGDQFSPVPAALPLQLLGKWLVLIKPACNVSTATAYRDIMLRKQSLTTLPLAEAICLPMERWQTTIFNDFESTVFPAYPEIAEAKLLLLRKGASYAAMSGSGATVFGLFEEKPNLNDVQDVIYAGCLTDLVQTQ